jgi:hypothetical protein
LFVEVIVRLAELSQFEEYLAKHEILKFASWWRLTVDTGVAVQNWIT